MSTCDHDHYAHQPAVSYTPPDPPAPAPCPFTHDPGISVAPHEASQHFQAVHQAEVIHQAHIAHHEQAMHQAQSLHEQHLRMHEQMMHQAQEMNGGGVPFGGHPQSRFAADRFGHTRPYVPLTPEMRAQQERQGNAFFKAFAAFGVFQTAMLIVGILLVLAFLAGVFGFLRMLVSVT